MDKIIDIHARQIFDSRGNPTIEVEVYSGEFIGSAAVPSGASTGIHEAHELRDNNKAYFGKGVTKAVKNVNTIIKNELIGESVLDQERIDNILIALDGTKNKTRLGANAILGVSLAVCRAGAAALEMPLYSYIAKLVGNDNNKPIIPMPFLNVINGGKHAGNDLMPQEFMISPTGAKTIIEGMKIVTEVYHELKFVIAKKYGKDATNVGDEGGFAPPLKNAEEAIKLIIGAIKKLGYEKKVSLAMDPATSDFFNKKTKKYEVEKKKKLTGKELGDYWLRLLKKYPIISLEDPFAEDDFDSWKDFMLLINKIPAKNFGIKKRPQIVGDDLTVTNPERIKLAINNNLCNALLLKVNQIGTLTEAILSAKLAFSAGWNVMVSHRSGETEDPFISDLTVGLGCGQMKSGAPCRGERTAKYNQLLRINEEISENKNNERI